MKNVSASRRDLSIYAMEFYSNIVASCKKYYSEREALLMCFDNAHLMGDQDYAKKYDLLIDELEIEFECYKEAIIALVN